MVDRLTLGYMKPEVEAVIDSWGHTCTIETLAALLLEYAEQNADNEGSYAFKRAADLLTQAGAILAKAGI